MGQIEINSMEGLVEINSMEKCSSNSSKNPRRGRRRRPRKKRQTVVSPTPTEQRVVLPPGLLHDTRICIEDLDFDETDRDELREEREMEDECRRWNAQTEATWVKEASKLLKSTRSPSQASATNEKACTRICHRTTATEGTSCMWCPARPQSLMHRLKTEGPMACDRLK